MLECIDVSKTFGGVEAVKKISLVVKDGQIAGLVGPNGSGKSTLLNLISGVYKPDTGKILFNGQEISKLPSHAICAKGITKTSQTVQSFPEMSMLDNVVVSVKFACVKEKKGNDTQRAEELLKFVGLPKEKFKLPAKNLNVIELRRVQLARALATSPKMLLLDELLTGLTPKETDAAIALVKLINGQGITILMVEHVMKVIMDLCDQVTVLHHGEKLCEGPPENVCRDEEVIKVYLGKRYHFGEEPQDART